MTKTCLWLIVSLTLSACATTQDKRKAETAARTGLCPHAALTYQRLYDRTGKEDYLDCYERATAREQR